MIEEAPVRDIPGPGSSPRLQMLSVSRRNHSFRLIHRQSAQEWLACEA